MGLGVFSRDWEVKEGFKDFGLRGGGIGYRVQVVGVDDAELSPESCWQREFQSCRIEAVLF